MEFSLDEIEVKSDPDLDPNCEKQKYHTFVNADWKLDPYVKCRVVMERLETPPSTPPQCQSRDSDEPVDSHNIDASDIYSKFKLMVEELLIIFTKCKDTCEVCIEYILKLCKHIAETHEDDQGSASTSSDFNCDICGKMLSSSSEFIRHHRESHSDSVSSETIPFKISDDHDISASCNRPMANPIIINLTSGTETFANDLQSQNISRGNDKLVNGDVGHGNGFNCDICGKLLPSSADFIHHRKSHSNSESLETSPVEILDIQDISDLPNISLATATIPIIKIVETKRKSCRFAYENIYHR